MKRVGFILKVREDSIDEYKKHHQNVWPEMKLALSKHGWHNYSLFMRKDGLMFGYFEAKNSFSDSLAGMEKEDINKKWQEFMSPFFENSEGEDPDKSMIQIEEVFHLD